METKAQQVARLTRKIDELQKSQATGTPSTLVAQRLQSLRRQRAALLTSRYSR